jgi:hypothetical protein
MPQTRRRLYKRPGSKRTKKYDGIADEEVLESPLCGNQVPRMF